ncbi:MAG: helix-turn-helix domain-containing protein [Patescibacteria group bacterium]|nr:helix-turn-helix domain-containing protein [Patescibacteria group bacterium]
MKAYKTLSQFFNLGEAEAKIYIAATKAKDALISDLAKAAGLRRTSVYLPLEKLIEKGLITKTKVGKRIKYNAVDPQTLSSIFDQHKGDIDQLVQNLSQSYLSSQAVASVEYFSGTTGVNSALEIFLDQTKDGLWKTFESNLNSPIPTLHRFEDYICRRVKRKIASRCIISMGHMTPWLKERLARGKEELHEDLLISEKIFPMPALAGITSGVVIFIAVAEVPYAVLLKSDEISATLSTIHDLVWSRYSLANS